MSISELYEIFKKSSGISTDTRNIEKGNLFFALKGPYFNANTLADEALEKGAIAAVIDDADFDKGDHYVLVEDGLTALQQLANHHRKQFTIPFIGITGSNGKTTTKELIAMVLKQKFKVHFTQGNLNNHIGVPLTLLSMPADTEIAIIEMGANKIGDIEELCNIAEPDYGLITNIGKAHIEGFGSLEGVARGKSELYLHLLKNGGTVFVNSQDEHLMRMSSRFDTTITYPDEHDAYYCAYLGSAPFVSLKTKNNTVHTQLIGKYNFYNIAAALCIGNYFGVEAEKAEKAIEAYRPDNNRSQVVRKGTCTIIMDAYNANPESMKAAILNLDQMQAKTKMVILGDMFELGNTSESEHTAVGELVAACGFDKVLFVGKYMHNAFLKAPGSLHFAQAEEVTPFLNGEIVEDMLILIKGSRSMKMEQVLNAF